MYSTAARLPLLFCLCASTAAAATTLAQQQQQQQQTSDHGGDFVFYQPEQVHISVSANGSQTVVTWTTWNDTDSFVEFGTNPMSLVQSRQGQSTLFIDGGREKRRYHIHRVTLDRLKSNTTYFYHVGSSLGWSDLFSFRTFPTFGPKWSARFAIYGDMGNANAQSLPRLQEHVQQGLFDMVVHNGDMAYNLDSDNGRRGDEFMRQIEPIAAYVPYMTVVGNHESALNFSHFKNRFSMPGQSENMFYSFDVGPVHFVAISTEFYYYTNYGTEMVANQYEWIKEDLRKANLPENRSQRPWIVLFGHRPMYCSSKDFDDCKFNSTYTRVGMPVTHKFGLEKLLLEYNVDLSFWAHEHDYERFWPLYDYKVLNGSTKEPYTNPRGPVHIITGSAGCDETHDGFDPKPYYSAFRSLDYGYTRMTAHNATHLEIEQISDDQDGAIIDHFFIISANHTFSYTPE